MSIPKRLMIVVMIMALFCLWATSVYVYGRNYEWLFAVGYSGFVVATLAVVVFAEEISRLIK